MRDTPLISISISIGYLTHPTLDQNRLSFFSELKKCFQLILGL